MMTTNRIDAAQSDSRYIDSVSSQSPQEVHRKRSLPPLDAQENRRKAQKVTRACDRCKNRKAKCTGLNPCESCVKRGELCTWEITYSRGVPKAPLPAYSVTEDASSQPNRNARPSTVQNGRNDQFRSSEVSGHQLPSSRASPDVESARIRGQYYDSTSGLAFVHRAYRRLSMRKTQHATSVSNSHERQQPLMSAGDWPPMHDITAATDKELPGGKAASDLLHFYFEHCVVTYRLLHRPSVESWLQTVLQNIDDSLHLGSALGSAKASIILTIFAIVTFRKEQIRAIGSSDGSRDFVKSDRIFLAAKRLSDEETGLPRLESAQARLMQVLYLLQTARMNQAWYVFGNGLQIISALGLHRKPHSIWDEGTRTPGGRDYISLQCRKRTFWTAYTLDKYLCVVLGRPTHYHDSDIDQEFPDRVNDDAMSVHGSTTSSEMDDCLIDGLIAHAKLAQIIGGISSEVYNIQRRTKQEIDSATGKYQNELEGWQSNLPLHLGKIKPSSLVPELRRQAVALKLAFAHARMHLNRPFLLGNMNHVGDATQVKRHIADCLSAAQDAIQVVNSMAADGSLIYSLWWMYYVAFCALSVVYIFEIQHRSQPVLESTSVDMAALIVLADQCHSHLAHKAPINSPGRAYSVLLEELREEAKQQVLQQADVEPQASDAAHTVPSANRPQALMQTSAFDGTPNGIYTDNGGEDLPIGPTMWDGWSTTDWLDFDSSAFMPLYDMDQTQFLQ